ncbi:MAG: nucleoside recognition domain-containing protein [Bacteroidia bacterium]|nr:nucleoside recognition domain-containing protein [Bacteroidia bacterium]
MNFFQKILFPSLKKSGRTTIWLLKIILPISLLVRFLDYFGALTFIAQFLDPVFVHLGLPGSTAIIFITSIFLPLYAPLAIIMSMTVTLRELTILALMCQIAHNLPVESAIQSKTGTSFGMMFLLRVVLSIAVGILLNLILPKEMGMPFFEVTATETGTSVVDVLWLWLKSSAQMALLIFTIITALNVIYKLLEHYNLITKLSRAIEPILRFFGLPASTGFLWLIGYIVGLAYGGAMMIDQMNEGKVTKSDAELLNYHLAVSHSVIEDNLLFVALGVSVWWILGVRLAVAWIVVWVRKWWMKIACKHKKNCVSQ